MALHARASRQAAVLALLLAVLLATAPGGGAASVPAAAGESGPTEAGTRAPHTTTSSVSATSATDGATTGVEPVTEHRGDVVSLALSLGNASTANLSVSAADGSYEANATVVDEDGDGQVTVRWNTYLAGHGGALAVGGDDELTVRSESSVEGRIPVGEYELSVSHGGERIDERTVELRSPGDPAVEAMVPVPGRGANLSSASAIRTSLREGSLTSSRRFGLDGHLVLALHVPGIGGALAAQPGTNATERFATLFEQPGFALSVRENASTVTTMVPAIRLGVVGDGVDVLAAPDDDAYYLVYDADEAPRRVDRRNYPELEHGDWFDVNVTVGPRSGLVEERTSGLLWNVAVVEWQVSPQKDVVPYVQSADAQVVVTPTTLPNGTPVTVVLQRPDGSTSRRNATVSGGLGGARITGQFDLAEVPAGASVTVRYLLGGERLPTDEWRDDDEASVGVVSEPYTVSVLDVERTGEDATPLSLQVAATVPDGSILVVHAENASGRYLGATGRLADGRYNRTVQVTRSVEGVEQLVVVVHADTGEHGLYERDPVVVMNGTPVAASAPVPRSTQSPTATATETPTPVETTGQYRTTAPSGATTRTTPGFGPLAALLAALVVAVWVRRR